MSLLIVAMLVGPGAETGEGEKYWTERSVVYAQVTGVRKDVMSGEHIRIACTLYVGLWFFGSSGF